jgi:hypothetical protein
MTPAAADDGGTINVDVMGGKDGYVPMLVSRRYNGAVLAPTAVDVHKALLVVP